LVRPLIRTKKVVLSFLMGPPNAKPNWFCLRTGRGCLFGSKEIVRVKHLVAKELENCPCKHCCRFL
jgi:hypothetical protein